MSYSGRIATREIRETIPLINLRGDLPINLEWKGSTNQPCFFIDREPTYCSIFAKRIKGENEIFSVTSKRDFSINRAIFSKTDEFNPKLYFSATPQHCLECGICFKTEDR